MIAKDPKEVFSINDPIHALMQFSGKEADLVYKIISTSEFQRLRFIKNLGMDFIVYPGATHNRFSHSLGVAYLAKRMFEKLQRSSKVSNENKLFHDAKNKLKFAIIAAGLLHDIGHGPYSHLFERVGYEAVKEKLNHEEMGIAIIERISKKLSHEKFIITALNTVKECFAKKNRNKDSKQKEQLTPTEEIIISIISSKLDADRMDYLLRDSYFCGVDYGHYDVKWLIHSLKCCTKNGRYFIGIDRKAVGVIEHLLMARRLMTVYVYKHKKVVAAETIVIRFLEEIYKNIKQFSALDKYKSQPLINYFSAVKNAIPSVKKSIFLKSISEYLSITDIDIEMLAKSIATSNDSINDSIKKLAKRIYYRQLPICYEIDQSRLIDANLIFKRHTEKTKMSKAALYSWQLFLDERKIKTYDQDEEKIYIIDRINNIKSLNDLSLPIFSISNKDEINPILIIDAEICKKTLVINLLDELQKNCCFAVCDEAYRKK